jgi:hypothetical protein
MNKPCMTHVRFKKDCPMCEAKNTVSDKPLDTQELPKRRYCQCSSPGKCIGQLNLNEGCTCSLQSQLSAALSRISQLEDRITTLDSAAKELEFVLNDWKRRYEDLEAKHESK